jgi:hypothetical protein
VEPVLERFRGDDAAKAPLRYREFVAAGLGLDAPWNALRGQVLLGSDLFAERLRPLLAERPTSAEIPREARLVARPTLEALLPRAGSIARVRRDDAIVEAYITHCYTLSEIARHLGLHYSTVSRIAKAEMRQGKT